MHIRLGVVSLTSDALDPSTLHLFSRVCQLPSLFPQGIRQRVFGTGAVGDRNIRPFAV